jgi:glycosyltransferase involved in cell wall biosynthesis
MKILLVLHTRTVGGVERHALALMQGLRERGHEVAYAGPAKGWLGRRVEELGLPSFDLRMRGYLDLPSMFRLARLAREFGADLLHGHSQRGSHYAAMAGLIARLPAVATAHSPRSWRFFGAARRIIAVSDSVRRTLIEHGRAERKIRVVYNGVVDLLPGIGNAPELRDELDLPPDALIGGMVSRLVPQKGHDLIVRVMAEHADLHNFFLVVVGPDRTRWGRQVRELAESLGVAHRLRFLGERHDVGSLMASFDFVLAPSRQEGFSLTLIEAASVGKPVIATAVDGNAEMVVDGVTGLLTEAESVDGLARAIRRLRDEPGLGLALGTAARERYEREFTIDAMIRRTLAVYGEALDSRRQKLEPPQALPPLQN